MKLIADTNVVIAGFGKHSFTQKLMLHPALELISPDFLLEELEEHKEEIIERTKLTLDQYYSVRDILLSNIKIIPFHEYRIHYEQAMKIMREIDPDDTPFIALGLSFAIDGIWSNDKSLQKQKSIRIWTTENVKEYLHIP